MTIAGPWKVAQTGIKYSDVSTINNPIKLSVGSEGLVFRLDGPGVRLFILHPGGHVENTISTEIDMVT